MKKGKNPVLRLGERRNSVIEETKKPATFATRPCEVGDDLDMVEYFGSGMPRILNAYSRDV